MSETAANQAAWISAAGRAFRVIRYASATHVTGDQLWMIHDLADALHNIDMAAQDTEVFARYHKPEGPEALQRLTRQLNDSLRDPMNRRKRQPGSRRFLVGESSL